MRRQKIGDPAPQHGFSVDHVDAMQSGEYGVIMNLSTIGKASSPVIPRRSVHANSILSGMPARH
jgi:hypothetical protein